MVTLAGTPDHASSVDVQLVTIAHLAAEQVGAATYASITAVRSKKYTTVALSHDLVRAIDEAQYADSAGPCLDALDGDAPIGVPDIDATVQWPGFREAAPRMGLQTSVSVPLYAGRGDTIAVLNVYGHDRAAMAPLIAGVLAVHGHPAGQADQEQAMAGLDAGSLDLVNGYAEALSIRATIRFALELIRSGNRCSAEDAYVLLCIRAGEAETDLAEAATALIGQDY
jgi:hypothetical protein